MTAVPSPGAGAPAARWRLDVLGGLRLHDGTELHTRLATRAVTALLLRLALWPQRDHPREELVELLWPGVDASTGRARLRQALSQLKAVLEPAGHALQPVLQADRINLRLQAGSIACDAIAFDWCNLAMTYDFIAVTLMAARRWPEALVEARRGIALAWRMMDLHNLAYSFWNIGRVLARCRQPAEAVAIAGFVSRFWQIHFGPLSKDDAYDMRRIRRLALRQLDAASCAAGWARGAELALGEAVALAVGE